MKVRQLIEKLEQYDDDQEVHFGYNYGDYWKTEVAPHVGGVHEVLVKHSNYHQMPKVVTDADCEDCEEEELPEGSEPVVLITGSAYRS